MMSTTNLSNMVLIYSFSFLSFRIVRATDDVLQYQKFPNLPRRPGFSMKSAIEIEALKQLLKEYDYRTRPHGTNEIETDGGPVIVTVNLYLRSISKVDDVNMEYSTHFTFREEWIDDRLSFNNRFPNITQITLPVNTTIWRPDTFFQNEKNGRFHDVNKPNVMLRIKPDGTILYSVRFTLMLSCPMQLQNYPLDTQECFIDLASYAYTESDIEYRWKLENPIQIKDGLHSSLPSFNLNKVLTSYCKSKTLTGSYSCLRTILILKREFSYYLLQLYIPSLMLVGVSWVSFWLDKDSVPARVTLGVTTLLTMSTQASGINATLPPVSYTKAIDVWIGVCLAFIFGALLEFALVNYAARRDIMDEVRKRSMLNKKTVHRNHINQQHLTTDWISVGKSSRVNDEGFDTESAGLSESECMIDQSRNKRNQHRTRSEIICTWWRREYESRSKRIDVLSRIMFPLAFLFFNIFYWATYLTPYFRNEPDN